MKSMVALVLLPLSLSSAHAAPQPTYLECTGHDDLRQTPTAHEIVIIGERAEVDGKRYEMKQSRTEFTLTGPIPKYDRVFYINRLTGEWALTPSTLRGDPTGKLESSAKGEGCEMKRRKF
jgi:hypothetical protein